MKTKTNLSANSFDLWLGKPAPRYTSYPPAPFFHTGITTDDYARSLSQIPMNESVSLYIHVPFCKSLCLYCGCNTAITQRAERVDSYIAALKHEISMVAAITGRRPVSHLHFGGGTPNILNNHAIHDLFVHLKNAFDFSSAHEIAMELDPRVVTLEQVKTLATCGISRVSLGVQDFNPQVQAIVHRHQPYEMVEKVCDWLRKEGIRHINFDLMYGLPHQTPESVADTAKRVCTLHPDRVALFSYAHVPQIKTHQQVLETYGLPDPHQRLAMDQVVRGILISEGYYALGIDHFARHDDSMMKAWRAGELHRNFQGYTEDGSTNLIGLGASSISQIGDGYFQNEREEFAYQDIIASGQLPIRRGFLLSQEDRVRRAIIEQLMCTLSCDVEAICKKYQYHVENLDDDMERLKPYEDGDIIARKGYALCVTTPYRMAVRVICEVFDGHTRHHGRMPASRTA